MTVVPLVPDIAPHAAQTPAARANGSAFGEVLDALGSTFAKAEEAEDAFAAHRGDLTSAVYARAKADVTLAVAAAAAQRAAQAVQTVLSMQV